MDVSQASRDRASRDRASRDRASRDLQLRLSLSDADFLSLLRQSPAGDFENGNQGGFAGDDRRESRTRNRYAKTYRQLFSPLKNGDHGDTEGDSTAILPPRHNELQQAQRAGVVACFSTADGALTISGRADSRFPLQFSLLPGSRSYGNFIEFILSELNVFSYRNSSESAARESLTVSATLLEPIGKEKANFEPGAESGAEAAEERELIDVIERVRADLSSRLNTCRAGESHPASMGNTVEFFRSDFKRASRKKRPAASLRRPIALKSLPMQRSFSLSGGAGRVGPQLISGFVNLEIEEILPEAIQSTESASPWGSGIEQLAAAVRSSLRVSKVEAVNSANALPAAGTRPLVAVEFELAAALLPQVQFLLYYGPCRNDSSEVEGAAVAAWIDEEIALDELQPLGPDRWRIVKSAYVDTRWPDWSGRYRAAFCLTLTDSQHREQERIWFNDFGACDVEFEVALPDPTDNVQKLCEDMVEGMEVQSSVYRALSSFDQFVRIIGDPPRRNDSPAGRFKSSRSKNRSVGGRALGKALTDVTQEDKRLRTLVSEYYRRAVQCYEQKNSSYSRKRLRRVITLLQNMGVGEVVLIAPEGPHAIAGGLAQVVVGLSKAIARLGVPCSIVSPLYEQPQGNKHPSAEELLTGGVQLMGKVVPVNKVGQIGIPFGGSGRPARTALSEVYLAENENVRLFLLRHPQLADRLYGGDGDESQLRRAIFLSRGALELVRDPGFGLDAHLLLTNDWPSGLVPFFLRTDKRYSAHRRFQGVETCHIVHNGGKAYQGRFTAQMAGEDLWPILGVDDRHVFGLLDPQEQSVFNLSAAAAYHSGRALVAVSRPYAKQLLDGGGEGLEAVYRRAEGLYGVSNGVDLAALGQIYWQLGENARHTLGLPQLLKGNLTRQRLVKHLPSYKAATKCLVQRKFGLSEDGSALLVSLVGRIAEQKGVSLLSGKARGSDISVMRQVLERNPKVQFLICGPIAAEDGSAGQFRAEVEQLAGLFPGRIVGAFQFVAHEHALEITLGSDLFLMPSRYEPGGITQLEALACGTPVVAHNVGGISATLTDHAACREKGNSFLFEGFTSDSCLQALIRALDALSCREKQQALIEQAAVAENDWAHRAPKYIAIFQSLVGVLNEKASYSHLAGRRELLKNLRAR